MTRIILLAVLGLAVAGGRASADCGRCDEKYGWNPLLKLRSLFGGKKACGHCGAGGPRGGYGDFAPPPGIGYPGTPGSQMPGTLVFPNHPYSRSPRDFFMYEPK